jgi:predicted MFS family arabinose efflux permease
VRASVVGAQARGTVSTPWIHVLQAAAALAAAMGVGRFVYTPIIPLMTAHAGLSASAAASLATANYLGYFLGALASIVLAGLARSSWALRCMLAILTLTLAAMPSTQVVALWWVMRLLAGVASAVVFVIAVNSLVGNLRGPRAHMSGWGIGGVGVGIALSGLVVLLVRAVGDWRDAWWAAAALAAALSVGAWTMRPTTAESRPEEKDVASSSVRATAHGQFAALLACYSLEGVGYIIAGTFLVAAIEQTRPGWIGTGVWVIVGVAAVPSSALWAWGSRRWSRPGLLLVALLVQAAGVALPAVSGTVGAAVIAAAVFGGTFVGIVTISLAAGTELGVPRAVAVLTAGYSFGQILGPLIATPVLRHGYQQALLLAAAVLVLAAAAAAVLRLASGGGEPFVPLGDS